MILVTGGAGFIGSHLVDHLVSMRAKVKVVDNLSSGRIENLAQHRDSQNVEIVIGDLKDREICINVVKDVEVVFHFAANPEVRVSTIDPETHFRENIVATFNLLEAMRRRDVKVIVFASSSSVYGEPEEIPVKEDAPIRPVSVYGATKAACETLIHAYTRLYGFKAVIFRYANVVGPRLRHGVIYDFLQKLKNNPHKLEILGDGTQIRSFIYVDDAVEATILAYQKSRSRFEIYNVASEDWITIKDVADIVVKTLNLRNVKYILKPVAHGVGWLGDVKKIALDISKLKSLGWKPKLSSREAAAKTVKDLSKEILR
ncbi:MAG TPA: SDR family NAD(P)-dependent oxidoreductase [Pyrodictium sp.]|nr:SDR family NAD(P)-dependent oxidoreductase [Pyrodictium sp.]